MCSFIYKVIQNPNIQTKTWLDFDFDFDFDFDLTTLGINWLDCRQQVTTSINDKKQSKGNDMATYSKQDWTHDKNQPMRTWHTEQENNQNLTKKQGNQ